MNQAKKQNIVNPAVCRDESERKSPLYKALQVSGSKKSSKYYLTKGDQERGFYFLFGGLEVPFRAIIQENKKVKGIASVSFGTARDCPSRALGLCQLPDTALCYARAGEKRATRRDNENGSQGMDSIYNGLLCSAFWDKFESNSSVRLKFMEFLDSRGIETLRFNLKGDFRHCLDCLAIFHLANYGYKLTGYTARDDLAECEELGRHENIILNGSNRIYTNRFRATDSISEYLGAKYKCLGDCSKCRKCYTLRGVEIIVLVHGNGSQTQLNNSANWELLNETLGVFHGVKFDTQDPKRAKGLLTCINKALALRDLPTFADFGALKEFLREYLEN